MAAHVDLAVQTIVPVGVAGPGYTQRGRLSVRSFRERIAARRRSAERCLSLPLGSDSARPGLLAAFGLHGRSLTADTVSSWSFADWAALNVLLTEYGKHAHQRVGAETTALKAITGTTEIYTPGALC